MLTFKSVWVLLLVSSFVHSIWKCPNISSPTTTARTPSLNCWKEEKSCRCLKSAMDNDEIKDVRFYTRTRQATALRWRPVAILYPDKSRSIYDYSCYHNEDQDGCHYPGNIPRLKYEGNSKIPVMLGIMKANYGGRPHNATIMYNWETTPLASDINIFPLEIQYKLCNTSQASLSLYKDTNLSIFGFNLTHRKDQVDVGIGSPDKDTIFYQLSAVTDRPCTSRFEIFTNIFLNISIVHLGALSLFPITLEEGYALEYISAHHKYPWGSGRPQSKPYTFKCTKEHPCIQEDWGYPCCKGCCNVKDANSYPIALKV